MRARHLNLALPALLTGIYLIGVIGIQVHPHFGIGNKGKKKL
jgi:hypothetical protein